MVWVLISLAGLAGLLVLALSVPVDLTFSLEKDKGFQSRARIGWLFGLVGKNLGAKEKRQKREKLEEPEKSEEREKLEEPKKQGKKRGSRMFLAILRTRGFPGNSLKLARRLLRAVRVRELKLDLQIGLGDPAETGFLFGFVGPVLASVSSISSADINVEPVFHEQTMRGYCKGSIRVFPIRLVLAIVLFAFSLTTVRVVRAALGARQR